MTTRTTTIVSLILIVLGTLAGLLLWNRFPEQMASHWDVNDRVNGHISKFWGVFLMPMISLGMLALFLAIPNIDPLKANIGQFRETFNLFITFIIGFMLYIHVLTLLWNLGYTNVGIGKSMLPALGLLFILIGFMLRKAKRNFFIGIRTPWTLSSDTVWDQTHQLGAVLFMASGILAFIGGLFGGITVFWFLLAPLIGSTVFLLVYSYFLYQRETRA